MENMPEVRNTFIRLRGNANVSQSEYVYPNNIRRSRDNLLDRLGIEEFRWHDLRHCWASYMRQDGFRLGHIGNYLGHQSAVST
jgi:integrase